MFNKRFCDVLSAIKENKFHCLKRQLGLKIDDMGLLRYYGRFSNVTMAEGTKHPKLLPRQKHLTTLLIIEVRTSEVNPCWCYLYTGPS